jgi:hypothetical protein
MLELYADDTTIHFSSNSISDINIKLNEDMEKVQVGCTSNDMGYKYYEIKINDNPSLDEIFETILLIC